MTDKIELPDLPKPLRFTQWTGGEEFAYTADQMRAYAISAIAADRAKRAQAVSVELVDDALAKVSELGTVGAMKWLCHALLADASLHIANAPQVPDGFVLMPRVMTVEMAFAMFGREGIEIAPGITCVEAETQRIYDLLLSAAPQPEQKGQHERD